jgi:hypothetical protein
LAGVGISYMFRYAAAIARHCIVMLYAESSWFYAENDTMFLASRLIAQAGNNIGISWDCCGLSPHDLSHHKLTNNLTLIASSGKTQWLYAYICMTSILHGLSVYILVISLLYRSNYVDG